MISLPGRKNGFWRPLKGNPGGNPPGGEGQRLIADNIFAVEEDPEEDRGGLTADGTWDLFECSELPFAAATAAK